MEALRRIVDQEPALAFLAALTGRFPACEPSLVGGAVRDALLGRRTRDFDFVIRGISRKDLEAWLERAGTADFVGRNFGVYKFVPNGYSLEIDIAFPRTERPTPGNAGGYRDFDVEADPSLPLENDLARRDFTVNAMAWRIRDGMLIDPFGGQNDLARKQIRAVGNPAERFGEDYTRLLRGLRFAAELDFAIEKRTWDALVHAISGLGASTELPDGSRGFVVSREMVGEELAKLFAAGPRRALDLLVRSGALAVLFPEIAGVLKKDPSYLDPVGRAPDGDLTVAFALLLRAFAPSHARAMLGNTGLTSLPHGSALRADEAQVGWMVDKLANPPPSPESQGALTIERHYMGARGERYLAALRALDRDAELEAALARVREICRRWNCKKNEPIASLVSGSDVVRAGVAPGPAVREFLDRVRDAQLEGLVMTRDQALAYLEKTIDNEDKGA